MTAEFTGERVVPGQVDVNLWNEHMARYAFAARLARGRRVLDAGCGTGYGSAELATVAASVTGLDLAAEAVEWGRARFEQPNLWWARGSCAQLPFRDGCFDLVVAFEVIEHLAEWPAMLAEVRRVLAPGGQFLVSTPNKSFYAKTREVEGPNPFHEHEFEFAEFDSALRSVFPHVSMFLEDHAEGVLFRPLGRAQTAEVRVEAADADTGTASFYVAVCAMTPQTGAPAFVYIPRAANLLAEKLEHIERLEGEIETKDRWLAELQRDHAELLEAHRDLKDELEQSNRWAAEASAKLEQAGQRIVQLQNELNEMSEGYEKVVAGLNAELESRTRWAMDTETRLTAEVRRQSEELARCVEILHQTEATLEERTRWALALNEEKLRLEGLLKAAQHSRWLRLGRRLGLGPELGNL